MVVFLDVKCVVDNAISDVFCKRLIPGVVVFVMVVDVVLECAMNVVSAWGMDIFASVVIEVLAAIEGK